MRSAKLFLLPAALSFLAFAQAAPAQACIRGCGAPAPRDCTWAEPCGARRLDASFSPAGWQPRAVHSFTRTVTRFDVEGIRLLQRMP